MYIIPPIEITDARLTSSNIPEPDTGDYTEFNIGTAYVAGNKVTVSTVQPNIHRNYEAVQATTGDAPWLDDGTNWIDIGPTNRWAMFDDGNSTQSEYATTINVTLTPGISYNAVAFINVDASTIQVVVDDPVDGVVYDNTFSMVDDGGIQDWYAYFFTQIEFRTDLVISDLPVYLSSTIQAILTQTGGAARCGSMVVGFQSQLGITDYGTGIGIKDYSVKSVDAFGNFVITQRAFSKRADFAVTVNTDKVARVQNMLSTLRATPLVWIGNKDFGSTIIFGYYRDFDIILSSPLISQCNITVEGLT